MAQTKRKRQTKHRGNAAGSVTTRGRTGRPASPAERKKQSRDELRQARLNKKPTWESSAKRAMLAAAFMFVFLLFTTKGKILPAVIFAIVAMILYVPAGYYLESFLWKRRMQKQGRPT